MSLPEPGQKFVIQNWDTKTVLEVIYTLPSDYPTVKLRPMRDSESQYWTFSGDRQYIQSAVNGLWLRVTPPQTPGARPDFSTDSGGTRFKLVPHHSPSTHDGAYQIRFGKEGWSKALRPTRNGLALREEALSNPGNTDSLKDRYYWGFYNALQIKPSSVLNGPKGDKGDKGDKGVDGKDAKTKTLTPQSSASYRIRSFDGWSVLTAPDSSNPSNNASVYADKQDLNNAQRQQWVVTKLSNGNYTIQSASNRRYLGAGSLKDGDRLVATNSTFEWDVQDEGGFFWSIRVPKQDLSLGVPNMEVRHGDKVTLVTSDYTPSQLWFIEKFRQVGDERFQPVSQTELPPKKYLIRSARDEKRYFSVDRLDIFSSHDSYMADEFVLEYKPNSGRCFLKYYSSASQTWYYVGRSQGSMNEAGLSPSPQELVILKGNDSDYLICLADVFVGKPRQVISNETRMSGSGFGEVFLIQGMSESPGLASISLMWRFMAV